MLGRDNPVYDMEDEPDTDSKKTCDDNEQSRDNADPAVNDKKAKKNWKKKKQSILTFSFS